MILCNREGHCYRKHYEGEREEEARVNRDEEEGGSRVAKQDERSGGENVRGSKTGRMEEGGE